MTLPPFAGFVKVIMAWDGPIVAKSQGAGDIPRKYKPLPWSTKNSNVVENEKTWEPPFWAVPQISLAQYYFVPSKLLDSTIWLTLAQKFMIGNKCTNLTSPCCQMINLKFIF